MRILVVGASGFTNLGDDAILAAMLHELRGTMPARTEFEVVSGSPERLAGEEGIVGLPLDDDAVAAAVERADLAVVGGGGLVYDHDFRLSYDDLAGGRRGVHLLSFFRAAVAARRRGIPVLFYAIGVGPLVTPGGRRLTAEALGVASAVTVRDGLSYAEVRALGVSEQKVELTADPSVRLPPAAEPWPGRPEGPTLGIVARPWFPVVGGQSPSGREFFERYLDCLASMADHAVRRWDATPVFVAAQRLNDDDLEVAGRVLERMEEGARAVVLPELSSYRELQRVLGACDALVSARLHPLIFAARAGVPGVGVSVGAKVRAFLCALGLQQLVVSPWIGRPADFSRALDLALGGAAGLREQLRAGIKAQAAAAARNPAVAATLVV